MRITIPHRCQCAPQFAAVCLACGFITSLLLPRFAAVSIAEQRGVGLIELQWHVDGVTRSALVHVPTGAETEKTPLVFVFHGRDGGSASTARRMAIHQYWPEAIVVYPQGLPAAIRYEAAGVKPGWQQGIGDQNDRDLKFVDEMLTVLRREVTVDDARIYVTGHSLGGNPFKSLIRAGTHDYPAEASSADLEETTTHDVCFGGSVPSAVR